MKNIVSYSNSNNELVKKYVDLKDSIISLSDEANKIIMITSPKVESGNEDLAANLAVVMSKNGYKTLIVDCNIEKSALEKLFNVNTEVGLSNYVKSENVLSEVIKNTEIDKLKIITTGQKHIDILGNRKIENLITEVKNKFDYIILNAPSILSGNGTQVLAKYCDSIVIVVEHEKTEVADIKKAQARLDRFQKKVIGYVLNNFND